MMNRRRQLIVDPGLQKRVMRDVGLLPFVTLVVGVLMIGFFTRRILAEADYSGAELPSVMPLMFAILAFVVVTSFALLTQGLRISNRVAGPEVRFRRLTDAVLRGEQGIEIQLRSHDYPKVTAEEFNKLIRLVDSLRERIAQLEAGGAEVDPDRLAADVDSELAHRRAASARIATADE